MLDLFCGAGGAAVGYHRAFGPDTEIVGVDNKPQPRYPFAFVLADAIEFMASGNGDGFDFYHASPPCQAYSTLRHRTDRDYPMLIGPTRRVLVATGKPYVIENVAGAPLLHAVMLCGTMFRGLRVIRHRYFECSHLILQPHHNPDHPPCFSHDKRSKNYGLLDDMVDFVTVTGGGNCTLEAAKDAMGIDWMLKYELNEAIPPAYTEWIGKQFLSMGVV